MTGDGTRAAAAQIAGAAIVVEGADMVIRRFTCSRIVTLTKPSPIKGEEEHFDGLRMSGGAG